MGSERQNGSGLLSTSVRSAGGRLAPVGSWQGEQGDKLQDRQSSEAIQGMGGRQQAAQLMQIQTAAWQPRVKTSAR